MLMYYIKTKKHKILTDNIFNMIPTRIIYLKVKFITNIDKSWKKEDDINLYYKDK